MSTSYRSPQFLVTRPVARHERLTELDKQLTLMFKHAQAMKTLEGFGRFKLAPRHASMVTVVGRRATQSILDGSDITPQVLDAEIRGDETNRPVDIKIAGANFIPYTQMKNGNNKNHVNDALGYKNISLRQRGQDITVVGLSLSVSAETPYLPADLQNRIEDQQMLGHVEVRRRGPFGQNVGWLLDADQEKIEHLHALFDAAATTLGTFSVDAAQLTEVNHTTIR